MISRHRRTAWASLLLLACSCSGTAEKIANDPRITAYLERHVAPWVVDARCVYEELAREHVTVYTWIFCRSPDGSQGLSAPVKLNLDEDGAPFRHALPRDGANYSRDLEELFPRHVISRLSGNEHVDRVSRLWSKSESSAE